MRRKMVNWITVLATDLSAFLLRKRTWHHTANDYRAMRDGSVGRELIRYMDCAKVEFNPRLVRHDVKHILLEYDMSIPDELRICAFQLGNRSANFMAVTYLCICLGILPELIPSMRDDFKRGRNAVQLRSVNLEEYLASNLTQVRAALRIQPRT